MSNGQPTETECFEKLRKFCSTSGFLHAIAYLSFRDNVIKCNEDLTAADLLAFNPQQRLIRTEISTLLRLCGDSGWDFEVPAKETILSHAKSAESLLKELHQSFLIPLKTEPPEAGDYAGSLGRLSMQEPIFYSGESAYDFQYKKLAALKYKYDSDWLLKNKGYTVEQAVKVIEGINEILSMRASFLGHALDEGKMDETECVSAFLLNSLEISSLVGLDDTTVTAFLDSFTFSETENYPKYNSLFDFNVLNAYPIISYVEGSYLLLQWYSLVEALYETPMFWFLEDRAYRDVASENRGRFTESFSEDRLVAVFGRDRVFRNVNIYKTKGERIGEIDVLVLFADRAIVLQAKSKKLTIAARKGSEGHLRSDFKKAVQDAYDQAFLCSTALLDKSNVCKDANDSILEFRRDLQEVYPICVVSDHYPSLNFQVREFLKVETAKKVMPPFVVDVFFLDVFAELLPSPLLFTSYVNRRVLYGNRILAGSELVILSYHLKRNLWLNEDVSLMHLSDEINADIDVAMMARRAGIPGLQTPEGILTRYKGTFFGEFITSIENVDLDGVLDLGFILLQLGDKGVGYVNDGVTQMSALYMRDKRPHDFSFPLPQVSTGLTIHVTDANKEEASIRLNGHCEFRKYAQRADSWFGLCVSPITKKVVSAAGLKYPWLKNDEQEALLKFAAPQKALPKNRPFNFENIVKRKTKIGRNDPCPCGSGKKYKKCCES